MSGEKHGHETCGCCRDNGHGAEHEKEAPLLQIAAAAALFAAALIVEHIPAAPAGSLRGLICAALYLAAYLLCGRNVVLEAVRRMLRRDLFSEQFLMSLASLCAVCVGEYPEAVAVMLFYQVGEYFQDYALDKSRDSINALMEIRPDRAVVLRDGTETEIPADEVRPGDRIVVRPGGRVPVDGRVVKGRSFTDNSALTGESVPVEVTEGCDVFSGAVNTSAALEIEAVRPAGESAASRIIELAEHAAERKTKTERFITRFSRIYTPAVCAAALAVAVVPSLLTGDWRTWIYRAISFLVVSCPCALVISVPLSFFGGIGAASRRGILVKGSGSIEALARAETAVFDKTGTLTKGSFTVTAVHCAAPEKLCADDLLAAAAHAEKYSTHPVSKSLKTAHCGPCCEEVRITAAEEISGQGVQTTLESGVVLAGNLRLMESRNVRGYRQCPENDAGTVVHVAVDGEYAGHIVISDEPKPDAKKAVESLKKLGVKKIVMLTGDADDAAQKTARELGITEVFSQLLPEDKVAKVEELISERHSGGGKRGTLIFAGDGINDAPVLSRADVGIAMGALGSDAAIESADVVMMTDEPAKISEAVKIARKTVRVVRQNIVFSLSVKAAVMILCATGLTNLWWAVFGDVGVTFLAVINAMRLLAVRKPAGK